MSVVHKSEHGWIISHEEFIKSVYKNVIKDKEVYNLQLKKVLFNINCPFLRHNEKKVKDTKYNLKKKRKNITSNSNFEELKTEIDHIEKTYKLLFEEFEKNTIFNTHINNDDNREAQTEAENCYNEIDKYSFTNAHGSNGDEALIRDVNGGSFLFPNTCRFFCKNITEMRDTFHTEQFDLILLDPPWWNKYIRRKRARSNQGYQMMYNLDLGVIPMEKILAPDGLVVVWCTNSPQHLKDLQEVVFPKWGIRTIAKWFWLKVTCKGDPICSFSEPPGKQPFEQILFAAPNTNLTHSVPNGKLVVSIPSALHSHKPPLVDLLSSYVGNNPRCLEIFARYLLPGWTSWGLEVAKLQHECLYEIQN